MDSNSGKARILEMRRTRDLIDYHHHVKNLMANIRVIAARTARNSDGLEDFIAHFDGRLAALGRTQKLLARAGAFEIDLEELVREELLTHAAEAEVGGPAIRLTQKSAEILGLALHELATNAVKFGALAGHGGRLAVLWREQDGMLLLEWRESGVPSVSAGPAHSGFGREWLEDGLSYQLGGETGLDFLPDGILCRIAIPLGRAALSEENP